LWQFLQSIEQCFPKQLLQLFCIGTFFFCQKDIRIYSAHPHLLQKNHPTCLLFSYDTYLLFYFLPHDAANH
jgi:hypothetical protein